MSTHSILRNLAALLRSSPATQLTFVAGAGISVPSGLPTGWAFNKSIATFIGGTLDTRKAITHLLTIGYTRNIGSRIRFEQIIHILRSKDPTLEILRVFDETGPPTGLHRLLALYMSQGAAVFTTNFDSLIERAYYQQILPQSMPRLYQVIYEDEYNRDTSHQPGLSFKKYLRLGSPTPAILKLHGSLRVVPISDPVGLPQYDLNGLPSIGATLDKIGRSTGGLQLEAKKEAALISLTKGRIVCILGYSGADDLDVIPSLATALEGAMKIIWIRHEPTNIRAISGSSPLARFLLPPSLREVCIKKKTVVICGNTSIIVQKHFRTNLPLDAGHCLNVNPVDAVLHGYEPYANMDRTTHLLLSAQIAEEATSLVMAKWLYKKVLICSKLQHDEPSHTFALFRLGAIARNHCKVPEALKYLRSAFTYAQNNKYMRSSILNMTGVVVMDTGKLKLAFDYFQLAQKTNKTETNTLSSGILTNLGLVERKRGNFSKSLQYHKSALRVSMGLRDRAAMARDYGNIGTVYLRLEKYVASLRAYNKATRFARLTGARHTLATVLMNQAIVLKHLKRYPDAERLGKKAFLLENALKRPEGIARYWSLIAGVAHERKDFTKSTTMLRKAIRIQKKMDRCEGLADDYSSLGDSLIKLHKHTAAKHAYQKSKHYFKRMVNHRAIDILDEKIRGLER